MIRGGGSALSGAVFLVALNVAVLDSQAAEHQITASVVHENGTPLLGIAVQLRMLDGTLLQSKQSHSSGTVRFSRVQDGGYVVIPRSKSYMFTPVQQSVVLTPTSGNVTLGPFVGALTFVHSRSTVPGVIEFEDFDDGAPLVAYYDRSRRNEGGKYRDTRVDLRRCDDQGGGYCVFRATTSEWLNYSVQVPTPGDYRMGLRVGLNPKAQGLLTVMWDEDPAKTLGPVVIPKGPTWAPTVWTTIQVPGTVKLDAGHHTLKVTFNSGTAEAQFNHIVIARAWPQPVVGPVLIDVVGLVPGGVDDVTAIANGQKIQQAIQALPAAGGIVQIPAGLFYLRQPNPVEGPHVGSEVNMAVYVNRGDFVLRGAGAGKTILKAKNRATSFLHVGNLYDNDGRGVNIRNIVIEGMTFQSNPFVAPNGQTDLVGLSGERFNWSLGAQINLFGNSPQEWIQDVEVRRCEFLDLHTLAFNLAHVKQARFVQNRFVFFSTGIPAPYQALDLPPNVHPKVGIFSGALRVEDLEILDNTFTGNGGMTLPTDLAADGFVWLSQGGNWLVADNVIQHYRFEGTQLNAGPASVERNRFVTLSDNPSSNALSANHANAYGPSLSSPASLYAAFSFVGNVVEGGQAGVNAQQPLNPQLNFNAAFDMTVTSNTFNLVSQSSQTVDPPTAVILGYVREARVSSNSSGLSGRAVHFATINDGRPTPLAARLIIHCNDFSRMSWGAFLAQEYAVPAIERVLLVANVLGRGNTGFAHLQFDNVYPPPDGAVTEVLGVGNLFFNSGASQEEAVDARYSNRSAIKEDIRNDRDVFSLF